MSTTATRPTSTATGARTAVLATMPAGTAVEVRNRFTDGWSCGFEIADVVRDAVHALYRLRRVSDGVVLPDLFDESAVRPRL